MSHWHPSIPTPWSAADLEGIVDDALTVLAQVGVACGHRRARERLADGGGVTWSDGRLRFSRERVRWHLEERRWRPGGGAEPDPVADEAPVFSLGGCWACLNYCDPESGRVRPARSDEAAAMIRLWDARELSGVVPLIPGDVPPALATLAAERLALLHSRHLGGSLTVTDPEEIRVLAEMNRVAGRRYRLMQQVGISPLRFNDEGLEVALAFAGQADVEVTLAGFIPMAGATCPLDPRAAAVQSVAETVSLDLLATALDLEGGGLMPRLEPFDLRYATIVFGSPEWCLYRTLALRLGALLSGHPIRDGSFRSVAKQPDAQACCERMASVLWQALLGVRRFGAVGQLSVDEVFSPQQAALDREILAYVERLVGGLELDASGIDAVGLIREGVAAGTFLAAADTVEHFREFYTFPELFRHWNVGRWQAEGAPTILSEAWARAQAEMAGSTHRLDEVQTAEIERLYAAGRERIHHCC